MNHFQYKDDVLHCEDVPLVDVAKAAGTPVYVYSTATLERHYDVFRDAFAPQDVLIAFAVKANANVAVISTLARKGAGADTVSAGEIKRALAAGVPPERIVFSGVGKTEDELVFALETRVYQINVESTAELELLETLAVRLNARPAIAIRVNPDIGAGGHEKITTGGAEAKFGVGPEEALALYARASKHSHILAKGLAVHIGSQIRSLAPLAAAFAAMRTLVERLRASAFAVERLDLGGGLGVPYFNEPEPPTPHQYAGMVRDALGGADIALAIEPGRLIAANAGILLTRVIRIQERPDRRMLVLDAGMNDLIRPAMYDAFHELRPIMESNVPAEPFDLVGPICETGDTFARARSLPPMQAGDLAAFMTAGAYGAVMASTYNARPLPPEVLVKGDRFEIVRRRFDVEDQLCLEHLPAWLAPHQFPDRDPT